MSLYMLCFYKLPKGVMKRMIFLGLDYSGKLIKVSESVVWLIGTVCSPKVQVGLSSLDFENTLLGKWLWKLVNENGLWQELIRNKYLGIKTLSQVTFRPGDSQF